MCTEQQLKRFNLAINKQQQPQSQLHHHPHELQSQPQQQQQPHNYFKKLLTIGTYGNNNDYEDYILEILNSVLNTSRTTSVRAIDLISYSIWIDYT